MTPNASADVTGIVLAGGRSSRFGRQKLDEPIDGVRLVDHAVRAVAAVADEIVIAAAAEPAEADAWSAAAMGLPQHVQIRTVHDPEPFGGPLVGLGTALAAATGRFAIVVGGDMPKLQTPVLEAMLAALATVDAGRLPDAVVLDQPGGSRPLPCALRVEAGRLAAERALGSGARSLRAMLDGLSVHALPEAAWRPLDPLGESLLDIDRPADLDRLKRS